LIHDISPEKVLRKIVVSTSSCWGISLGRMLQLSRRGGNRKANQRSDIFGSSAPQNSLLTGLQFVEVWPIRLMERRNVGRGLRMVGTITRDLLNGLQEPGHQKECGV